MSHRIASNLRSSRRLVGRRNRVLARAAVDACEPRRLMASVSGTVFNDADRDGVRDAGDNGASGITVFADKNYDGVMQSAELRTVTDANGFYRISGIVADNTSTGIRLSGVAASSITAPAGGGHSARFASDYEAAGRNFGVVAATTPPPATGTGTLSGFVWNDENGDATLGGDAGLPGVRVYVDQNRNGVYETTEPSGLSNGSGEFAFAVPVGEHVVRATLAGTDLDPAAYRQTSPTPPAGSLVRVAAEGTLGTGLRFGFAPTVRPAPSASVAGVIYDDANRNGVRDPDEASRVNVTVFADLDYDGVRDANEPGTASRSDGTYLLKGIPLSNNSIAIRAIAPAGATITAPVGGAHSGRHSAAVTYGNRNFGIAGGTVTPPSTGTAQLRTFFDANGNGAIDGGETGPRDASVWADLNNNGLREAGEPMLSLVAVSGGVPTYGVGNLAPGNYTIALRLAGDVDLYADYKATLAVVGGQTRLAEIVIPTASSLGGVVYTDANGNGTRDAGDGTFGGVTVFADYDYDGVLDANEPGTTSVSGGAYRLYGIRSDNVQFWLTVIAPARYAVTQPTGGVYKARFDRAYDLAPQGGRDFGLREVAATTGIANVQPFFDENANGVAEATESGPPDATVWLDLNANRTRETNEPLLPLVDYFNNGRLPVYALDGVAPGTYAFGLRLSGDADNVADYTGTVNVVADDYTRQTRVAVAPGQYARGTIYTDNNANGVQDSSDFGVEGVTVFEDFDRDGVIDADEPRTKTVRDGSYLLGGVKFVEGAGYRITALRPSTDVVFTKPASGSRIYGYDSPYDFGLRAKQAGSAVVAGFVVIDYEYSGQRPTRDPYLYARLTSGTVYADYDNDNVLDAGEPTATFAADGEYRLVTKRGTFVVRMIDESFGQNFPQTYPTALGGIAVDTTSGDNVADTVFAVSEGRRDVNRLYLSARLDLNGNGTLEETERFDDERTVYGQAWADTDKDGVYDAGEPVFRSTIAYEYFEAVRRGLGDLYLDLPQGTHSIAFAAGRDADRELAVGERAIASRTVTFSGTQSQSFLALPVAPDRAGVTGVSFVDKNGDGVRQAGEARIYSNVFIDANDNGRRDAGEAFVLADGGPGLPNRNTDAFGPFSGGYYFGDLAPGTYIFRAQAGDAVRQETQYAPQRYVVTLGAAQTRVGLDFSFRYYPPGAVFSGTVFNDADRDGVRDAGEGGLAGRVVFADLDFDKVRDADEPSAVTEADGRYFLFGVPGNRSVDVRLSGVPAASITRPGAGSYPASIGATETRRNLDFGVIV